MVETPAPPEADTPFRIYLFRFPFRMMSYAGALSKAKASAPKLFVPGVRPSGNFSTRPCGWVEARTGLSAGAWSIAPRLFHCAVAGYAAAGCECCRQRSRLSNTTHCRSLRPFARLTPTRSLPTSRCVGPWRGWARGIRITRRCTAGWPVLASEHWDEWIHPALVCRSVR